VALGEESAEKIGTTAAKVERFPESPFELAGFELEHRASGLDCNSAAVQEVLVDSQGQFGMKVA
jgi:hypothetical protein